jgi:V/A-type H+-transporting ATPase subunit D
MAVLRIPPGRAGRLWLRERLAVAESAVSLLERKRALLELRQRQLRARRDETARRWDAACTAARTWQDRAMLLGGVRSLIAASPAHRAELTVHTTTLAGITYPERIEYRPPQANSNVVDGSATLWRASEAHRTALIAAADHAAAAAAVRAIERELTATRIRARALRHRRIPALRTALADLDLTLEERERAERIPLHRNK